MSDPYIWRYMSLAKYVDLLRSKSIFCPKASLFHDETEGKWIAHAVLWREKQRWQRVREYLGVLQDIVDLADGDQDAALVHSVNAYNQLPPEEERSVLSDVLKDVLNVYPSKRIEYLEGTINGWRKNHDGYNTEVAKWLREITVDRESTYISCWNSAPSMSLAMWSLYGGGNESLAIRLKPGKLDELLSRNQNWLQDNGLEGQVVDVDYFDDLPTPGAELQKELISKLGAGKDVRVGAFSIKPALYQYENEVRLIVYPKRELGLPLSDPNPELNGLSLSIGESNRSLSDFIEAVYVHPLVGADSMMVRVIKAIHEQFGLSGLPIIADKVEAIGSNIVLQQTGYTAG